MYSTTSSMRWYRRWWWWWMKWWNDDDDVENAVRNYGKDSKWTPQLPVCGKELGDDVRNDDDGENAVRTFGEDGKWTPNLVHNFHDSILSQ